MNLNRFALYILTCLIMTVANTSNTKAQVAAEIPVSYDVSETGAFQYSLPLRIPPGVKDMVPNLAITYSSQRGDGILGMGWSLSGLSAITRGVPTIFHDRKIEPVDFNADDVFFLDGQRLFWEASSSSYLTEVKNFAKIKQYGTAGNGPSYFIVEYPNGLTYEYGNTINSKMLAQGKSDVLLWSVNRITDKNGNSIEFDYNNNSSTGYYSLSFIKYVLGDGSEISLDFHYTSRSDANKQWIAGSSVVTNEVLEDIYVYYSDGSEANHYHFTYDVNIRTRLIQIDETRNNTTQLPTITINWGTTTSTSTTPEVVITNRSTASGAYGFDGDFNGDGFTDYMYYSPNNGTFVRFLNNKNNAFDYYFAQTLPYSLQVGYDKDRYQPTPPKNRMILDYDGDGMDDIVMINFDNTNTNFSLFTIHLLRANGTTTGANSFFDPPVPLYMGQSFSNHHATFNQNVRFIPGDFDDDGKTEIIIAQPQTWNLAGGNPSNSIATYAVLIVGDEYSTATNPVQIDFFQLGHIDGGMTLDIDGDGKDEYLVNHIFGGTSPRSYIYKLNLSYNSITGKPTLIWNNGIAVVPVGIGNLFPNSDMLNYLGDYNGDGKTDLLSWEINAQKWLITYSNGTNDPYSNPILLSSTTSPLNNLYAGNVRHEATLGRLSVQTGDFNGDGLEDILELRNISGGQFASSSDYHLFYSTGESFVMESGSLSVCPNENTLNIGDYNGDGQVDICSQVPNGSDNRFLYFRQNSNELKVTSIEHAGKTIEVDYTTISKDADYTSLSSYGHPYIHRTFPIKVVKHLFDNATTYNTYKYRGAAFHKYGLGFRGFEETTFENINGKKTHNKYTLNTQVPYLSESIVYDAIDASQPFGIKTNYYQFTTNGGANGSSRIIVQTGLITEDYINGQAIEKYYTVGNSSPGSVFYEFGQYESVETIRKDLSGTTTGHSIVSYTYDPGAIFINRAKPISITSFNEIGNTGNGITRTTDYVYFNTTGQLATMITDPATSNQTSTSYLYTAHGNLLKTTVTAAGIVPQIINDYTYTSDARFLETHTDAEKYVTTYDYGNLITSWGNPEKKTEPDGRETIYEYDDLNRVRKLTDYRGVETTTTYDWASNSPHTTTDPNEQFTVKTETTNISGSYTTIYDLYGRKIRETSPMFDGSDDIYTDYEYNNDGLQDRVIGPYPSSNSSIGDIATYTYDPFNRVVNVISGTGATSTIYMYIGGVLNTTITPPNNIAKTYLKWGDKPYRIFNNTENIEYTYYGSGTPKTINANGQVTNFTADAYGRLKIKNEPNAGPTEYFYDALDRVIKEKLPNTIEYEYKFDNLGRVIDKKEVGQSFSYTYTYEPANSTPKAGRLMMTTAPNGSSVINDYNTYGELIEIQESDGTTAFTTNYTYDAFGRKATHTYPAGDEITYSYNAYGFLNKVSLTNSPSGLTSQDLWTINSRNHLGQLTDAQYGVNSTTGLYQDVRAYNMYGFPTAREVYNNLSSATISDMRYNFNQTTGNLSQRRDHLRNLEENFTYDNDYERLTRVQYNLNIWVPPLPDLVMEYDNLGNILKKNDVTNSAYNWKYDTYALTLVPEPNTTIGAPFQPFEIPQNNTQDIEYYPFLKVKKVTEAQKNEVFFTYGPDNERIKAEYTDIINPLLPVSLKTKYYANNYEKIVDANTSDETHISYIWGGGEPIAILYQTTGTNPSTAIYYTVTDYLGSITHLLDNQGVTNGGIAEERSFDAWGRIRKPATWEPEYFNNPMNWKIDRGYTGHEHIWSSLSSGTVSHNNNIINMNGRLYDALVGRMYSPDPYVPDNTSSQDYNKYTYARNNPLKYTDPTGEVWFVPFIVAGVMGGGMNLYNNWDKVDNFWTGASYTISGVVGGAVSVVNPVLGASITTSANVVTDVATGNVPKLESAKDYAYYMSGAILDGLSVNLGGAVGRGVGNMMSKVTWTEYARTGAKAGSTEWSKAIDDAGAKQVGVAMDELEVVAKKNIITSYAQKSFTGYTGVDAAGQVRYAGITGRLPAKRFAEHLNSTGTGKELLSYRAVDGATNLTRSQARAWEQTMINQYGLGRNGGQLLNHRNSIDPKYWYLFGIKP